MGIPKMSGSKNQTSGTSACVWCLFKDPVMVAFKYHPFLGTVAQFFTIKNHWFQLENHRSFGPTIIWTHMDPVLPSRKTPGMSPCPPVAWLPHRWWSGWWWGTWVDKGWMARITNKKVGKNGEIGGSPMNCQQKLRIWPWFDPQKGLTWQKSKAKLSLHFT